MLNEVVGTNIALTGSSSGHMMCVQQGYWQRTLNEGEAMNEQKYAQEISADALAAHRAGGKP